MVDSEKHQNPPDDRIKEILLNHKNVAVVGLSSDSTRPSYGVARYLQAKGFKIIPVNPNETEVLGEKAYPDLTAIPEEVDIVDVFRRPEYLPDIVDQAIKIKVKVLWIQEGVINHPAALKASQNGITVVMDRCMANECRKYCN
jgi:predicted CoA-binding protein